MCIYRYWYDYSIFDKLWYALWMKTISLKSKLKIVLFFSYFTFFVLHIIHHLYFVLWANHCSINSSVLKLFKCVLDLSLHKHCMQKHILFFLPPLETCKNNIKSSAPQWDCYENINKMATKVSVNGPLVCESISKSLNSRSKTDLQLEFFNYVVWTVVSHNIFSMHLQ